MERNEKKRKNEVLFIDPNAGGKFLKLVKAVTVEKLKNLIFDGQLMEEQELLGTNRDDTGKKGEANENSSVLPRFDG